MSYSINQTNNEKTTIFLKNLSSEVDDDILFELGTQFGEVRRVTIPMNKLTMKREEFGFIEFTSPADAQYMRDVIKSSLAPLKLFGKVVLVEYRADQQNNSNQQQDAAAADSLLDIGAKIVIYNLDVKKHNSIPELLDLIRKHFSQFGRLAVPPAVQQSTNTATVSYTAFEGSDAAIAATDNQFLFGQDKVRVMYAMREDGRGRHGSVEERALYSGSLSERQAAAAALMQQQHAPTSTTQDDDDEAIPQWAQGLNPYSSI